MSTSGPAAQCDSRGLTDPEITTPEAAVPAAPLTTSAVPTEVNPVEGIDLVMRDLQSHPGGLSAAEAQRRLLQWGPNELSRGGGRQWPRELFDQLTHPLALLLWVAAALSFAVGSDTIAIAVLVVILLNAAPATRRRSRCSRAGGTSTDERDRSADMGRSATTPTSVRTVSRHAHHLG